ncbi:MAG: hypothetical protein ACRD8Z_07285 [Nitrososphaeraceae archaeon]
MEGIHIPLAISTFVIETLKSPALLVGCRVAGTGMSKPCCEYDLLVFSNSIQPHKVMKLESYWAELLYVPLNPKVLKVIPDSADGIVLNDTDDLRLSSIINAVMNNTRRSSSNSAMARKLLVSILIRYNEIERMSQKSPIISSMLLKISAYEIMQSLVYFSGLPSSPFHQLESIRRVLEPNQFESEIISLALEIIGMERATASVLRRCIPSYSRLAANRYDRALIEDKINFLYESGMTADCYYYVGRICSDILKSLDNTFWHTYAKLVQLGMDLSMDIEHIQRWNPQLTAAARQLLRSHRTVIAG